MSRGDTAGLSVELGGPELPCKIMTFFLKLIEVLTFLENYLLSKFPAVLLLQSFQYLHLVDFCLLFSRGL